MQIETYRSKDLLEITGISKIQLNHWVKAGAIVPLENVHGRGKLRTFSRENLYEAFICRMLNQFGCPTDLMVKSLDRIRRFRFEITEEIVENDRQCPRGHTFKSTEEKKAKHLGKKFRIWELFEEDILNPWNAWIVIWPDECVLLPDELSLLEAIDDAPGSIVICAGTVFGAPGDDPWQRRKMEYTVDPS